MLFDRYDMIVPMKNSLPEYEAFYSIYGQNIKIIMLCNQMLKEKREELPNFFLEMYQNILEFDNEIDPTLFCIGLKRKKGKREFFKRSISIDDFNFIRKHCKNDIEIFIDHIANYQQIIILYGAFESTIKDYILRKQNKLEKITQISLLDKLLSIEPKLVSQYNELTNNDYSQDEIAVLWQYYTQVRNLFAHSIGVLDNTFIQKMIKGENSLKNRLIRIEKKIREQTCYVIETTEKDLFNIHNMEIDKIYLINEYNIRLFREFIINIWETIYVLNNPIIKLSREIIFHNNNLEFRLCDTIEESDVLQKLPQTITYSNINFNISNYICPKCKNNKIFLYKIKFANKLFIDELILKQKEKKYPARNAFTCPFCKSFYFPKYEEKLSDNNGFNLLELNDSDYYWILKKFEETGLIKTEY